MSDTDEYFDESYNGEDTFKFPKELGKATKFVKSFNSFFRKYRKRYGGDKAKIKMMYAAFEQLAEALLESSFSQSEIFGMMPSGMFFFPNVKICLMTPLGWEGYFRRFHPDLMEYIFDCADNVNPDLTYGDTMSESDVMEQVCGLYAHLRYPEVVKNAIEHTSCYNLLNIISSIYLSCKLSRAAIPPCAFILYGAKIVMKKEDGVRAKESRKRTSRIPALKRW